MYPASEAVGVAVGVLLVVFAALSQGVWAERKSPSDVDATIHLSVSALVVRGFGFMLVARAAVYAGWTYPLVSLTANEAAVAILLLACVVLLTLEWGARLAAARLSEDSAATAVSVLGLCGRVFWPVVAPLRYIGQRLRGRRTVETDGAEGRGWASTNEDDFDRLRSSQELSETDIHAVMVARMEMVTLPLGSTLEEIRRVVVKAGHSRIPVYRENIDDIAGILHVKDMFRSDAFYGDPENFEVRRLLRAPFYVPEIMKIEELLREFQRRKTHMAVVVDEYGGTAGVVTLEDILEEIVGEIQDEYDVEEKQYRVVGEGAVVADARINVYDLGQELGVEFPEEGDFETLGGFLTTTLGELPEAGHVLHWRGITLTIKDADEKKITTVEISGLSRTGL